MKTKRISKKTAKQVAKLMIDNDYLIDLSANYLETEGTYQITVNDQKGNGIEYFEFNDEYSANKFIDDVYAELDKK